MQKVFVTYKLRPGVTLDNYSSWSREIDQRITPGQKGVIRFEVYAIEGADKGEPFCQVVEDIEVDSFQVWKDVLKSDAMAYVNETAFKFIDESSLQMIFGSRIVSELPRGSRPVVQGL